MQESTYQPRQTDSLTTGKAKGKPRPIGQHVGELGLETRTSFNEKRQAALAAEQQSQQRFTVTNRFYTALKAIYGSKFEAQFATPAEVKQSKAMWCEDIEPLPEKRLMACLRNAKREMKTGNPDYQWPNIGLILGYCNSDWERQCHKPFIPAGAMIEDKTGKEKRRNEGLKNIRALRETVGL